MSAVQGWLDLGVEQGGYSRRNAQLSPTERGTPDTEAFDKETETHNTRLFVRCTGCDTYEIVEDILMLQN